MWLWLCQVVLGVLCQVVVEGLVFFGYFYEVDEYVFWLQFGLFVQQLGDVLEQCFFLFQCVGVVCGDLDEGDVVVVCDVEVGGVGVEVGGFVFGDCYELVVFWYVEGFVYGLVEVVEDCLLVGFGFVGVQVYMDEGYGRIFEVGGGMLCIGG